MDKIWDRNSLVIGRCGGDENKSRTLNMCKNLIFLNSVLKSCIIIWYCFYLTVFNQKGCQQVRAIFCKINFTLKPYATLL